MQYGENHNSRVGSTGPYWRMVLALTAAVACAAYAFNVVGLRVLNPLNLEWLNGDPATAYLGWAFFRQEAHLTLPLGWLHSLGYPFGEPAAYLDAIPVVAVFSWFISLLIKSDFQYLGIYFLLCCVFQFYFGYRITLRICKGNGLASVLGAGFFLTAPAFTWRAYGHFALASHWVILAALDQFMAGSRPPSSRQAVWRGVVCFMAGGINPYIAAMTLLVTTAAYIRPMRASRQWLVACFFGTSLSVLCTIAALALFGFIRPLDVAQYVAGGYGYYSMNLLAPVDPGTAGSLLLKQQPTFPGQYEGNNYLGLGLLLLGVISVARAPSCLRDLFLRTSVPAVAIIVMSLMLALSTRITFGQNLLYEIPVPSRVLSALGAFRGSGRLFWPAYYLIFAAVISAASRSLRGVRLSVALGATLMIQLADGASMRADIRSRWQSSSAAPTPSGPDWHHLGQAERNLVVLPAWQCSPSVENDDWWVFGRLALLQRMTINTFYAARYSSKQIRFFCSEQISNVELTGLRSDTAYVFHRDFVPLLAGVETGGNFCRYSDQYILCSHVAGRSRVDPSILSGLPELHPGDTVDFAAGASTAGSIASWGLWMPEPWGRWAQGHLAVLAFRLPTGPQGDALLDLSVLPFLSPSHPRQNVKIFANRQLVAQITIERIGVSDLHIVVPGQVIGKDRIVQLVFRLPDAISPAALGQSIDARDLSIGLIRLHLDRAG